MKKVVLTMVALLSMTVMQAQNENKQCCEKKGTANEQCCQQGKNKKKGHVQKTAEERTAIMADRLALTDAQKTKVAALNKEYEDVLKAPGMTPRPPKKPDASTGATEQQRPERPQLTDAQKAEMKQKKAKRDEYEKKLKKILNDDQYSEYQKMNKPRRHHHGHGGPGNPHLHHD